MMIIPASPILQVAEKTLTSAQVKALAATNIELIASPGAGFAILPLFVYVKQNYGGTNVWVQTAGADHLAIKYEASNEIGEIANEGKVTAVITASADDFIFDSDISGGTSGMNVEANKAVMLDNNGANEYSGNAANDNTLFVRIWYLTVPA